MTRRVKLAAAVTFAVLLQGGVLPAVRIVGVVPDLGLLVALAVAIRLGPTEGALVAFAAGLGYDLLLQTPLGLTALSNTVVVWTAGTLWTGLVHPPRWVAPWAGLIGGLAAGAVFCGVGFIFGVDALRTWNSLYVVTRSAMYDAVLAIPVFVLVDRMLRDEVEADRARW